MNTKIKIALIFLGAFIPIFTIELYLRVVYKDPPFPQLTRESRLFGFEHIPNANALYDSQEYSVNIQLNSFGLRGEEISKQIDDDTIRIALIGDSFTEGLQVNLEDTVAKRLELYLNKDKNSSYQLLDFSVGGYGIDQKYLTIREKNTLFQARLSNFIFYIKRS